MKAKKFVETRTTNGVKVEVEHLAFRDKVWCHQEAGLLLGPVIKVTRLTENTARTHGFSKGEAYSLKEYGGRVHYISPHALVVVEGQNYTMKDFYSFILTL